MGEVLTAAQMRAIEETAISSGQVTGLELMERAGRGVVEAVFAHWRELAQAPHRAVVLCGPGNNGGDGFVVARRLRDTGWDVEVLFFGDADRLSADARKNHDVWAGMGDIRPLTAEAAGAGLRPALLVDAMFGTGLSRAIPLELANAHHMVGERDTGETTHSWLVPYHVVAVDCPSGLDCDSGQVLLPDRPEQTGDEAEDVERWRAWWQDDAAKRLLRTDLTLAFHRRKIGHILSDSCGDVRVIDIGLGAEETHPAQMTGPRAADRVIVLDDVEPGAGSGRIWPGRALDKRHGMGRHKYDHGHALVLTGGAGRTGAARLAARGALRIGAGLVTLGVPGSAQLEVAGHVTAMMLRRVNGGADLTEVLADDRINALCLGPGLGVERARELVPLVLGAGDARPAVLDADALTAFDRDPEALFGHTRGRPVVLTPHGGEFGRLFPDIAERLTAPATVGPAYSKVNAARDAAARAGCTVLFKGPDTVIAGADGRCAINASRHERAAPWLATAGAGDVMAGFITGLLARGCAPRDAAEIGAWLHTGCALSFGPGLIAEDLPEELPKVFRGLGL